MLGNDVEFSRILELPVFIIYSAGYTPAGSRNPTVYHHQRESGLPGIFITGE
jgi:hypothetical protein